MNATMENPAYDDIKPRQENYYESPQQPRGHQPEVSPPPKSSRRFLRMEIFIIVGVVLVAAILALEIYQIYQDSSAEKIQPNVQTTVSPGPTITGSQGNCAPTLTDTNMQSCMDYFLAGDRDSGVYTIFTDVSSLSKTSTSVYCEMTDTNGWTVILQRKDGSVTFDRNWESYKRGFGDASGEYYIGNDVLNSMTTKSGHNNRLRVDLMSEINGTRDAEYSRFSVANETNLYKLVVEGYSGTAGDSLLNGPNGRNFSTHDSDNDKWTGGNCAATNTGGWWYTGARCGSHLTGLFGQNQPIGKGITWNTWLGNKVFLDFAVMKITYDI